MDRSRAGRGQRCSAVAGVCCWLCGLSGWNEMIHGLGGLTRRLTSLGSSFSEVSKKMQLVLLSQLLQHLFRAESYFCDEISSGHGD